MIRNIFFFVALLAISSCCLNENSPEIPCLSCEDDDGGGGGDDVIKKVLIEEFTGVRCVNCPQGSAEIENLLSVHGDKLVAISLHAGFFSEPYPESLYDLRTPDGDNLEAFLGPLSFFPTAVIDRTQFAGETEMVVGQSAWSSYIADQLAVTPTISVEILPQYDNSDRSLSIVVSGTAQTDLAHDIYLTVLITENHIIDIQLDQDGIVEEYDHKHVLRDVLTPFNGSNISPSFAVGDTYEESFNYTLPAEWDETNCTVIAYIHRNDSEKTVLQVEEISLAD